MAETILTHCSVPKWHWYSVQHDLEEQGGLKGVVIDPVFASQYGDIKFVVTWEQHKYLLITMTSYSEELVEAFSRVVEYRPFCRYSHQDHDMVTIEWDKVAPDERFAELSRDQKVSQLVRLNEGVGE